MSKTAVSLRPGEWIRVDLLGVVDKLALQSVSIVNGNIMSRCPYPDHDDGTPSFGIRIDDGVFHCYGCNRSGNVVHLIKNLTKCT